MTVCNQWDIVLLPFPFTDFTALKKRPCLIVSPDIYNSSGDVVVVFITSNIEIATKHGDYNIVDYQQWGLPKPSLLRMKFATVAQSIIIKKIGAVPVSEIKKIKNLLINFFEDK